MPESSDSKTVCPTCGAPLCDSLPCPPCTLAALGGGKDRSDIIQGPEIPGLTLHEEIGEGGFGIIYRASQKNFVQRSVALKVLKRGIDTRAVLRRFAVERQALASLDHPNIARFYEAGETQDGLPWFTMEFIEGEPITEALAGQDWQAVVRIFLKVCQAVAYAHERGILHRDLKPSNILLSYRGEPKVIDFGVAKAINPEAGSGMTLYTADELRVGTPCYHAPETADEIDERSDIYSLGRTLFELLSGITPGESPDLASLRELVLTPIPSELEAIVRKAAHPDRAQRYASANDFASDLQCLLNGERVSARKSYSRYWRYGLFALGVLAAIAGFFVFKSSPVTEPDIVPQPISYLASGHPHRIKIRADGTRALAVFRNDGRCILFDPRDGREIASIPAPPYGIGSGTFSEDGKRFALGLSSGHYRWFSAENGFPQGMMVDCTPRKSVWINNLEHRTFTGESTPTLLCNGTDGYLRAYDESGTMRWEVELVNNPYGLAVDPAATHALVGSGDGRLNFINLQNQTRQVLSGHRAEVFKLIYASDGKTFACANYDGRVSLWEANGKVRWLGRHEGRCEEVVYSPDNRLLASASWDGSACIWEVETGERLHQCYHFSDCLCVRFSPDGLMLASGGRDEQIRLWDVKTGQPIGKPFRCEGGVAEIAFAQREDRGLNILTLTWNGRLEIVPLESFEL